MSLKIYQYKKYNKAKLCSTLYYYNRYCNNRNAIIQELKFFKNIIKEEIKNNDRSYISHIHTISELDSNVAKECMTMINKNNICTFLLYYNNNVTFNKIIYNNIKNNIEDYLSLDILSNIIKFNIPRSIVLLIISKTTHKTIIRYLIEKSNTKTVLHALKARIETFDKFSSLKNLIDTKISSCSF